MTDIFTSKTTTKKSCFRFFLFSGSGGGFILSFTQCQNNHLTVFNTPSYSALGSFMFHFCDSFIFHLYNYALRHASSCVIDTAKDLLYSDLSVPLYH